MTLAISEISGERFWKTVVAGLIATYVMTMTGFWQSGLGLAAVDVGAMITGSMTAAHPDEPYTLVVGNLAPTADDKAVIWTKPDDLPFDPKKPHAGLKGLRPGGFLVSMSDGAVRLLFRMGAKRALDGDRALDGR